jgi:hypothetical protein
MPWLSVNQTRLARLTAVPMPLFALDVQRAGRPGQPGAKSAVCSASSAAAWTIVASEVKTVITDQSREEPKGDMAVPSTDAAPPPVYLTRSIAVIVGWNVQT